MKKLILLILLAQSYIVFSQSDLKKIAVTDTFRCYDFSDGALHFYFELPEVKNSGYNYHFRYKRTTQIIDIYSNDTVNFQGFVMNVAAQDNNKKGYGNDYIYFFDKVKLKDSIATSAGKLILNKICNSPDSKDIEQWSHNGLDCNSSEFNLKYKTLYNLKEYSCYIGQTSTNKEISVIKTAIPQLNNIIDSQDEFFDNFTKKLEKGKSYYLGFPIVYLMTEKEIKAWNDSKPIRDYLKSNQEEIDTALKQQIEKLHKEGFDCIYNTYIVTFSKSGKLKNVTTPEKLLDSDDRKCFRTVKRMLKQIDLSGLNLEYGFTRDLHFYEKTFTIRDRTLYESD